MHVLLRLCQFENKIQKKLTDKKHYQTSITNLKLGLPELQIKDQKISKIKKQSLKKDWKDLNKVLH